MSDPTPESPPFTRDFLAICQALAPAWRGVSEHGHTLMDGSGKGIASMLDPILQNAEQQSPLVLMVLASRSIGLSPEGFLILRGALEDTARQIMHAFQDPRAASPFRYMSLQQPVIRPDPGPVVVDAATIPGTGAPAMQPADSAA